MKKTLIVGTVAYDEIETVKGNSGKVLGGAGTYICLLYTSPSPRD